jgi:hypothetical protein
MGYRWQAGSSYLQFKGQSVFPIFIFPKQGSYTIDFEKQDNIIAHPASDYIIKAGDELEVRDCDYTQYARGAFYIGKTKKGVYVVEDKDGHVMYWSQIRKASNPKSKAIAEIKKIAQENGIDLKRI